jgi:hypothetical protein
MRHGDKMPGVLLRRAQSMIIHGWRIFGTASVLTWINGFRHRRADMIFRLRRVVTASLISTWRCAFARTGVFTLL